MVCSQPAVVGSFVGRCGALLQETTCSTDPDSRALRMVRDHGVLCRWEQSFSK